MKRISPEALAQTDELLDKMRGVASVTSAHLEAWWSTKHRVRRLELYRLLNDLADDGRVVSLPGRRWGLPGNVVPVGSVRVTSPVPVPPKPVVTTVEHASNCTVTIGRSGKEPDDAVRATAAPLSPEVTVDRTKITARGPVFSVTLNIDGKPEDAVTITGQVKERVDAVVRAYQRETIAGTPPADASVSRIPFPARGARFERGHTTAGKPQPKVDTRRRPATGTIAHKILTSLKRGPKTDAEIRARLDLNPNTLRGRLSELVAGGWLAKGDDGRWEVIG